MEIVVVVVVVLKQAKTKKNYNALKAMQRKEREPGIFSRLCENVSTIDTSQLALQPNLQYVQEDQ